MRYLLALLSSGMLFTCMAQLQSLDPVTVDPQHYKEQPSVDGKRVLRVKFGPGEKGRLQAEPERLIVCLSSVDVKMNREDGQRDRNRFMCLPGAVMHLPAGKHQLENLTDHVIEFVILENPPTVPPVPKRGP